MPSVTVVWTTAYGADIVVITSWQYVEDANFCSVERQREKRLLSEEIIELRRERDRLSLENSMKSNQVEHVSTDKDKVEVQLLNAEDTIRSLRRQVHA